jgi:hypothetical protein
MTHKLAAFAVGRALTAGLLLATMPALQGQTAGQPPSNYKGPTLFGVCVYVVGDTSYYSDIFSISGYFKFQAQSAFQSYATAQAKGAALKGQGCHWSTSKDDVTTQKEADKRLLGLSGRSAKGVETGWVFNAAAAPAAVTVPAVSSAPATAPAVPVVQAKAAAVTSTPAAGAAAKASASSTSPASSIGGNMTNSLDASKASATNSVNTTVSSTMSAATTSATGAIQGLFKKKPKPAAAAAPAPAAVPTPVTTSQNAAPLGFGDSESPLASTAEAHRVEGLVADVAGNDLIINVGLQAGVQVGMKLDVMHATRTVKDPATGKVLRTIQDKVGELTITNADSGSASGKFAGATAPVVGDSVKTPAP